MVLSWAGETARTRMRINLINPGPTRTRMRAGAYPGEDPAGVKPPDAAAAAFVALAEPACVRHGEVVGVEPA